MKTKRFLALILAAVMCFSLIQLPAAAADNVTFTAIEGTAGNSGQSYDKLIDGQKTEGSKWCIDPFTSAYIIIKASEEIVLKGYTFTTGGDNKSWNGRNPKDWTIYGCNDYDKTKGDEQWKSLTSVTNDTVLPDENLKSYTFEIENNTTAYQYYKLEITAVKNGTVMQLTEMSFSYRLPGEIYFAAIDGTAGNDGEGYGNLVDGNTGTKWCVKFSNDKGAYVVIKAEEPVIVTGYTFTTANDNAGNTGRNPKSWTLEGCNDYDETNKTGGEWVTLHTVTNDTTMKDVNHTPFSFSFSNATKYKYYRFNITENQGNDCLQMSEIAFSYSICAHEWGEDTTTQPTCTEAGYTTKHCNICGITVKNESAPALGHKVDGNGKCTVCGEIFAIQMDGTYYNDIEQAAAAATADSTIYLRRNLDIDKTFAVSKDITLDLNGFTLKMTGSGSVISVNNATFTLKDSSEGKTGTITGGNATNGGGACVNGGTFNMNGGTISGCTAQQGGGGVFVTSGTFNMEGGAISGCGSEGALYGGGIYVLGGGVSSTSEAVVKISNGIVEKCTAYGGGGIAASGRATVTIENDSYIRENRAGGYGGGINAFNASKITIKNSSIVNNTACEAGGINAASSASITLENAKIEENSVSGDGGKVKGDGGGIKLSSATLNMDNYSSISNNTAKENGGGIFSNDGSTVTITNGNISGNTAAKDGGGIFSNNGSTVTITNGNISGNTAAKDGGGIYLNSNSGAFNLEGGTVIGNTAVGNGGGIYDNAEVFNVKYDPQVYHNSRGESVTGGDGVSYIQPIEGSDSNIYLASGRKISGSISHNGSQPMVYVTLADTTQEITNEFETDCSGYISSDDENYVVVYNSGTKTHSLLSKDKSVRVTIDVYSEYIGDYTDMPEYSAPDSYVIEKGTSFTEPAAPSATKYRFLGWYKDGMRYDFTQPVTEDITLTAKWAANDKPAIELTADSYIVSGNVEGKAVIYLASYNAKGAFIDIKKLELTENNKEMLIAKTNLKTDGAAKIKAFLWGDGMLPLCEGAFRTLNK